MQDAINDVSKDHVLFAWFAGLPSSIYNSVAWLCLQAHQHLAWAAVDFQLACEQASKLLSGGWRQEGETQEKKGATSGIPNGGAKIAGRGRNNNKKKSHNIGQTGKDMEKVIERGWWRIFSSPPSPFGLRLFIPFC